MQASYDTSEVTRRFLAGQYAERNDLVREFTQAIANTAAMRHLLAEIGQEAAANNLGPVQVLSLGLMYGLTLGVLLEKERAERSKEAQKNG